MANIDLRFNCMTNDKSYLITEVDVAKEGIFISLVDSNLYNVDILLDKSTAIKFAKTLRTEINKIKE